jgi:hypothetical protein
VSPLAVEPEAIDLPFPIGLLPGDTFLTSKGIPEQADLRDYLWAAVGHTIRSFEQSPGEAPSLVSHAGVVVRGPDIIVEALSRVRMHSINRYVGTGTKVEIWRPIGIPTVALDAGAAEVEKYVGRLYGGTKILGQAFDRYLSGKLGRDIFAARRLLRCPLFPICSFIPDVQNEVWTKLLGVERSFGVPRYCANPDDIHDWCRKTIDVEWKRILKLQVLEEGMIASSSEMEGA